MTQRTYRILLTPEDEGGFSVSVPALPGCFTQGETIEEAIEMAKEAISLYIEVPGNEKLFLSEKYREILIDSIVAPRIPNQKLSDAAADYKKIVAGSL